MSQWPFGIDSSRAAEIARKSAQEEQKKKDEEERKRKIWNTVHSWRMSVGTILNATKK